MPSVSSPELPNPWRAFLTDLDRQLPRPVELHYLGGFVAAFYYELPRPTNDLDYVEVVPHDLMPVLQEIAGVGSPLAAKYHVHLQHVGVASLPESYATRLIEIVPGLLRHLRLLALDPHDVTLSKLTRNSPIDRDDVAQLARAVPLDADVLRARYRQSFVRSSSATRRGTTGRWRCGSPHISPPEPSTGCPAGALDSRVALPQRNRNGGPNRNRPALTGCQFTVQGRAMADVSGLESAFGQCGAPWLCLR